MFSKDFRFLLKIGVKIFAAAPKNGAQRRVADCAAFASSMAGAREVSTVGRSTAVCDDPGEPEPNPPRPKPTRSEFHASYRSHVLFVFAVTACATQQPEPEPAPVAVVKPEPKPAPVAPKPEPEPVAVSQPKPALPKTASALPRLGLAGVGALGVAGLLRVLRRRL